MTSIDGRVTSGGLTGTFNKVDSLHIKRCSLKDVFLNALARLPVLRFSGAQVCTAERREVSHNFYSCHREVQFFNSPKIPYYDGSSKTAKKNQPRHPS